MLLTMLLLWIFGSQSLGGPKPLGRSRLETYSTNEQKCGSMLDRLGGVFGQRPVSWVFEEGPNLPITDFHSARNFHLESASQVAGFLLFSDSWILKMGSIHWPETSVSNYHTTGRNTPEERRSHQHSGGSVQSKHESVCEYSHEDHMSFVNFPRTWNLCGSHPQITYFDPVIAECNNKRTTIQSGKTVEPITLPT
jgi:hypothetical protein